MTTWNIFLLEDDEVDKVLVQVSLRHTNIKVNLVHASTLKEAKELLDNSNTKWDCCLLDRAVPGGCGLDLAKHPKLLGVPCIMLTGYEDETLALQAIQQGLEDYLIKSEINKHILIKSIKYAIERNSIKKDLAVANQQLEELVRTDHLTGVLNRRGLEDILERLNRREQYKGNSPTQHGIILVDLDNFKNINDNYGYDSGDAALKLVANKIRLLARPLDHVARIGGDEFILLAQDVEDAQDCLKIAERIRKELEDSVLVVGNKELRVTASIGVARLNDANTIDQLLEATQSSLHTSKRSGKNTVCVKEST